MDPVIASVSAFAGSIGLDPTPLAAALYVLREPIAGAWAAVAIRHDRGRLAIRTPLATPAHRALLPGLVELLAGQTPGVRAMLPRARIAGAGEDPVGVELETTMPPGSVGMAIHSGPARLDVLLDELVATGMSSAEADRARALLDLVGRGAADAVSWRVRPPALLTLTMSFAAEDPGPDGQAWAAGCVRALAVANRLGPAGIGHVDRILDAGLPPGHAIVGLTCSLEGALPRVNLDVDGAPLDAAAAVLARLPGGEPSVTTAASAPIFGAQPAGTVALTLGDEPFGSLVVGFVAEAG